MPSQSTQNSRLFFVTPAEPLCRFNVPARVGNGYLGHVILLDPAAEENSSLRFRYLGPNIFYFETLVCPIVSRSMRRFSGLKLFMELITIWLSVPFYLFKRKITVKSSKLFSLMRNNPFVLFPKESEKSFSGDLIRIGYSWLMTDVKTLFSSN